MLKIKFEMVEPERKAEKERSVRLKAGETPVASMRMKRPRVGPRRCRGSVLASMPAHVARATRLINTATGEWRRGARLARVAGPSSEALPPGGQGRGHTTGPGCRQRQAQRRRFAMASR